MRWDPKLLVFRTFHKYEITAKAMGLLGGPLLNPSSDRPFGEAMIFNVAHRVGLPGTRIAAHKKRNSLLNSYYNRGCLL